MTFSTTARFTTLGLIAFCLSVLTISPVAADDGQPVAIRHWDGGGFTIETMWGFAVGLGVDEAKLSLLPDQPNLNLSDVTAGKNASLNRLPNQAELSIMKDAPKTDDTETDDGNEVVVTKGKKDAFTTVQADGLTFVYLNDKPGTSLTEEMKTLAEKSVIPDDGERIVLIATGDDYSEAVCQKLIDFWKPRLLVVNSNIEKVGDRVVKTIPHNTVAVSHTKRKKPTTRIVSLETNPYEISKELAKLFEKKEAACNKSRSVFAKLSVDQMNFEPSNGTHTPRWNTEHMMGRELGFFSQIYHAVDPEVPVMNINPAQMPKQYKFAHPDWTGEEEARQTKRVEAFTRRFAYLLDGMDLNKKAKGSRFWTPKSLLRQMERHYKEHTDNVIDKMKLDGWPKE